MEDTTYGRIVRRNGSGTGERQLLSSFISPNNENLGFGAFRIPKSFLAEFGKNLPVNVKIKCKKFNWKAKIDLKTGKIYGLRRFMHFYEITLYNVVQFDYYGEELFIVKIFKEYGVEVNYPNANPKQMCKDENMSSWRGKQYVADGCSLEYEKSRALWFFNSVRNSVHYFEMKMSSDDVSRKATNLRLSNNLKILYQGWMNGTKILLKFVKQGWGILIQWTGDICYFGKGWRRFVRQTELDVEDSLVLFTDDSCEATTVNVCIFKGSIELVDEKRGNEGWDRSFFKILSDFAVNDGAVVVPKCIKEMYGAKLTDIRIVKVAGESCFVFYSTEGGYLANIDKLMRRFNLKAKETIIFSMDNSNVLIGRIYQEDGKEIDYSRSSLQSTKKSISSCLWKVGCDSKKGSEELNEDGEKQSHAVIELDDDESSWEKTINAEVKIPAFIMVNRPLLFESGKIMIPEKKKEVYGNHVPSKVRLQFPNGRQMNIRFNNNEGSIENILPFLKEIRKNPCSIFVFSYMGEGHMLVNILDNEASEIQYSPLRTVPGATVFDQDFITGRGLKFLIVVVGKVFESGEALIPDTFADRFGAYIPATIRFFLKNGEKFSGTYLPPEKKITGLLDLIETELVERRDTVLFTYRGDGKFEIVIFDKYKVEKLCATNGNAEDMDTEKAVQGNQVQSVVAQLENEQGFGVAADDMDYVVQLENEQAVDATDEADVANDIEMIAVNTEFVIRLTRSNVNNSTHGVHIPRNVKPQSREWEIGEQVLLSSVNGDWMVTIVFSNGIPRFSAGWNQFARDNNLRENQDLVFTLFEDQDGVLFDVQIG